MEYIGERQFWDFTVHGTSCYTAAGISHHNSGKTECIAAEIAALAHGPPYPKWFGWGESGAPPAPLNIWLTVQTFPEAPEADARIRKLFRGEPGYDADKVYIPSRKPFLPHEWLRKPFTAKAQIAIAKDGTLIRLRSAKQKTEAFESETVHLLAIDEPIDKTTFFAQQMRLGRLGQGMSRMIYALTPYNINANYLFDLIENEDKEWVEVFYLHTKANQYRDVERHEKLWKSTPAHLRGTRFEGKLISGADAIYPNVFDWSAYWDESVV